VDFLTGYDTHSDVGHGVANLEFFGHAHETVGWSYTFSTRGDGLFILDHDVEFFGADTFGLWGFLIELDGRQLLPYLSFIDPERSPDTRVIGFSGGTAHTVHVYPYTSFGATGAQTRVASMTGVFRWHIEVPEPSTIAQFAVISFLLSTYRRGR
jgi:hypothetical protein